MVFVKSCCIQFGALKKGFIKTFANIYCAFKTDA